MMYKKNFVAVIKCNGNILRERKGGKVYLPFGSEYSILLKNKDARRAVVEIEVDGENVLGGRKLVLDGRESREIKGFMRNMSETNRFKFINKTKEIQKHRGDKIDDGLVSVSYQFEKVVDSPIQFTYTDNIDYRPYFGDGNYSRMSKCSNATIYSCNSTPNYSAPLADEGITVKGTKIKQNYTDTNIGILEKTIHTIIFNLKGRTNKKVIKQVVTVKTKFKCETCGRINKSINKYCFNCGTYLD